LINPTKRRSVIARKQDTHQFMFGSTMAALLCRGIRTTNCLVGTRQHRSDA
jgi:hypothetical protein